MQIRILTSIATAGGAYRRGQVISLDESTALEWIGLGLAEQITEPVFAVAGDYETAARTAPPKRKGR